MTESELQRMTAAREQFPALTAPGAPVFFDNPGGTQAPQSVADAVAAYLLHSNANTHGAFATSERTDRVSEEAHEAMAAFLGAADPSEVSFGANMTTLTFAVSRALGRELQPGDELLLTRMDHDANIAPWLMLAEDRGLTVRFADISDDDCTLDVTDFESKLSGRTRIAAFAYASNAVGTINDVAWLTRLSHSAGAVVYVDAVQYAPHGPIDVQSLGCDFLVCSPYKFFGPHAGVIYMRCEHSERLRPYKVRPASDTPPHKWETGTQSHEAMAGTTAAVQYLASLGIEAAPDLRSRLCAGMELIQRYERELSRRLLEGLSSLPLEVYGITDLDRLEWRVPTFAVTSDRHTPRELAEELGRRGFNLWDGNYYALALMERLGLENSGGALRIGLAHYNTPEEVDRLLSALEDVLHRPTDRAAASSTHTAQG